MASIEESFSKASYESYVSTLYLSEKCLRFLEDLLATAANLPSLEYLIESQKAVEIVPVPITPHLTIFSFLDIDK